MQRIHVIQSGTWHPLRKEKGAWLKQERALYILPHQEGIRSLKQADVEWNATEATTIEDRIGYYIKEKKSSRLLSIHGVESILSRIISEAHIPYLKMEKYRQGYVKALTDFIYHFRNVSISDLHSALNGFRTRGLSRKERDLIGIYGEYENKLPEAGYDLRQGLSELMEDARREPLTHLLGLQEKAPILFFGFNWITPLEEAFIQLLATTLDDVFFLHAHEPQAAQQSFAIQESIFPLLARLNPGGEVEYLPAGEGFFVSLANSLFHTARGVELDPLKEEGACELSVTKEDNRFQEVISVARKITALLQGGVSPAEIRITAPEYALYSSIIQEVFPRYHISYSLDKGVPLMRFPLALLLYRLVSQNLQQNPYPIREKIFSSPYVSFSSRIQIQDLLRFQEQRGVELVSREDLESFFQPDREYSLDYHSIRRIQDRAYQAVRPEAGTPPLTVAAEYLKGGGEDRGGERRKEGSLWLIQFYLLSQAEKSLYPWRSRMDGQQFKEAFLRLCQCYHICSNIQALPGEESFAAIRKRDEAIWNRVLLLLDELAEILAGTHSLLELIRVFCRLFDEGYLEEEAAGPQVKVQPITAGQYKEWGYTFLLGLVDGEFPEEDDFNFLEPRKEGLSLGRSYTRVDHARNTFYHLVRSTEKGLYLSQPLSHNGKMLPPSPFLHEVERLYKKKDLPSPEQEPLYSRREELLFIGEHVDDDYLAVQPLLKKIHQEDQAYGEQIREILRFDGLVADPTSLSEYEGIFPQNPYLADHLCQEIGRIVFTAPVFERYAGCPLRFLLDDLLQLKEQSDYHPDTSETGLFIRSLLNTYTEKACTAGDDPLAVQALFQEQVEEYFEKTYEGSEDAFEARLKTKLLGGLANGPNRGRPGLFKAFLDYEESAPDYLKLWEGSCSGELTIAPGLTALARFDRVDETKGTGYLLVYLYTTGHPPHPRKVLKGLSVELPLAIFLFQDILSQKGVSSSLAGGGYYMVRGARAVKRRDYFAIKSIQASRENQVSEKKPVFSGQWQGFIPDPEFPTALEAIKQYLQRLHGLMKEGVFHPSLGGREEGICVNCSFGRLCRRDELLLDRLYFHLMHEDKIHAIKEII